MSNLVREVREMSGLTQKQLARRAGVSMRALRSWETRQVVPRYPSQRKWLKALGLHWEDRYWVWPRRGGEQG